LVLSRKDYHTQYEPIWYGWNADGPRLVEVADRKQSDVWEIERPSRSELHPTMKPIELVQRSLLNSSKPGNVVLDPFGGSGSTLIAAEQTNRKCRMVELDPQYCDVILERWEKFTGKSAELIQG
jgi:DNA modification methylase